MTIIPIDDEDCVWFDCGNQKHSYPCEFSACTLDSCHDWNNCEVGLWDDLFNVTDLVEIRLKLVELLEEKRYLNHIIRICESELDNLHDGKYEGETNVFGNPITCLSDIFYDVNITDLYMKRRDVEDKVRRLRRLEFDDLKRVRRSRIIELW